METPWLRLQHATCELLKQVFITLPFMLSERVNVCEEYEHNPSCMHIFIAFCMKRNIIVSEDEFIITDNARRLLYVWNQKKPIKTLLVVSVTCRFFTFRERIIYRHAAQVFED